MPDSNLDDSIPIFWCRGESNLGSINEGIHPIYKYKADVNDTDLHSQTDGLGLNAGGHFHHHSKRSSPSAPQRKE
jgi:hypothetical protein